MTQDRRITDRHPDRPLDWSENDSAGQGESESTLTPELARIADAFRAEADADDLMPDGGMERLTAFDYFKRGWTHGQSATPHAVAGKGELPEGWKLAPDEPTDAMTYIGQKMRYDPTNSIGSIYCAMLSAFPAAPAIPSPGAAEDERTKFLAAFPNAHWREDEAHPSQIWAIDKWEGWQARASLSSPSERHEAEAVVFLRQASTFGPWIECKADEEGAVRFAATTARLAAPSSPSVSGTVDTPELRALLRQVGLAHEAVTYGEDPAIYEEAIDAVLQHTAQAVRAAREEALIGIGVRLQEMGEEAEMNGDDEILAGVARSLQVVGEALRTPQYDVQGEKE